MLGGMRLNESFPDADAAQRSAAVAELSARVAANLGLRPADVERSGLVDAYVTMGADDDALWTLWRLAGERFAPNLVETLIEVASRRRVQ
jgi:ribulose kinase